MAATSDEVTPSRGPGPRVLGAFAVIVLIGGTNFVAVRFSNRELAPYLGAAVRFGGGAILLFAVMALRRLPFPRGRALAGTAIYGLVTFTLSYGLVYQGLVRAPAAVGAVLAASAPLLTVLLAALQRVEHFAWRGVIGALFAIVGVGVMTRAPSVSGVPLGSLLALAGVAVCIAESGIVVKQFPRQHPVALNAVAMAIGTPPLLALSALTGERWVLPVSPTTWLTLAYLIPVGSVLMFVLVVYILNRWTATAMSYATVLFPVVSLAVGAVLAAEPLSLALVLGAAITIAGVYLGALRGLGRSAAVSAGPRPGVG